MSQSVDVVILAGGAGFGPSEDTNRAMIPVAGKAMLQWEVDALKGSGLVSRVYAVGDVTADGLDEAIPPTSDFLGNMVAGVSRAAENGARSVLIATCDIPLVTSEGIDDFVGRALETGADFCYPVIPMERCVECYPEMRRTYLKLKEGVFSGGNMVLVSVDFVLRNRDVILMAYQARKQPLRLAGLIGWGVLARVLAAQFVCRAAVDITALESAVSRMLGGKVRAVITQYAEIGEDVDKPEDLAAVERVFGSRERE
ncbi:MAG: NTP transferase domain-containing protein [Armatimonadota bacterium]|nr:NTP transferase domain-containing protein [Armatimonadota bacterium]